MMDRKVVLVTGAGRGIGSVIALEMAKEGYNVVLNYCHSEDGANQLCKQLTALGTQPMTYQCDISNENDVKNMVDAVVKKYGHIDVLVNNAAVSIDSLFRDKTVDDFKKTLDVNVVGTFLVSKYVGEIMYDNHYGKIINLSSTNGINTYYPMCIDYDVSKAGIISLTHNLAVQFAPYVNVNAVAPGFIATESEVKDMDEEFIRQEEEKIMVGRAGTELDVAHLVKFLASDNARFINNQVIKIDGGIYGDC